MVEKGKKFMGRQDRDSIKIATEAENQALGGRKGGEYDRITYSSRRIV
jgi:hypothetical protein